MSEASTASSDQDIAVLQFETLGHVQTKVAIPDIHARDDMPTHRNLMFKCTD